MINFFAARISGYSSFPGIPETLFVQRRKEGEVQNVNLSPGSNFWGDLIDDLISVDGEFAFLLGGRSRKGRRGDEGISGGCTCYATKNFLRPLFSHFFYESNLHFLCFTIFLTFAPL